MCDAGFICSGRSRREGGMQRFAPPPPKLPNPVLYVITVYILVLDAPLHYVSMKTHREIGEMSWGALH